MQTDWESRLFQARTARDIWAKATIQLLKIMEIKDKADNTQVQLTADVTIAENNYIKNLK